MPNLIRSLPLILLLTYLNSKTYAADKRVLCYFADWSEERNDEYRLFPKDVDATLCTHIVYAFAMPDLNDGIVPMDFLTSFTEGNSNEFLKLKTQNPNLKLVLSIGGWDQGSIRFSRLSSDPMKRAWFAQYACNFIRGVGFDGLDFNWQWPGLREGSNSADKENFVEFIKEIKRYFVWEGMNTRRPRLTLSVVLPPLMAIISKGFDISEIYEEADYFNLLTMDYHTSTEPLINHHAPLFSLNDPGFNNELTVDYTVNMFLAMNIDPSRMNLGIPMYGHTYLLESPIGTSIGSKAEDEGMEGFGTRTPGLLAYYEICQYIQDNGWSVEYPNKTAMGPYAFHENDWVAYDDVDIIRKKVQYANRRGLGGIMIWTIDQDDFNGNCNLRFPLARAAREAIDEPVNIDLINGLEANTQPPNHPQFAPSQIPLPMQTPFLVSSSRHPQNTPFSVQPLNIAPLLQPLDIAPPVQPSNYPPPVQPSNYPPPVQLSNYPPPIRSPVVPTYDSISCSDKSCFFRDAWMSNNIFKTNQSFHLKLSKFQMNRNNYYDQESN